MTAPSTSRDRILDRVRRALDGRSPRDHPGNLPGSPHGSTQAFAEQLTANGGQVLTCPDPRAPAAWLARTLPELLLLHPPGPGAPPTGPTLAAGEDVPPSLLPDLPRAPAHDATVGLSVAVSGAADTGSVLLSSDGGRAPQLLPPFHVVWLFTSRIQPRLEDALAGARDTLPRGLGIHSGPSKSADIGRVVVQGVHGPGRLIVVLLDEP